MISPIRARVERSNCLQLIFKDGNYIRALNAETEEEVAEILEHIRTNGYDLIAIEGQPDNQHRVRERRSPDR